MKPTFMVAAWNLPNAANMISLILGTCGICFYGWIMRLHEQTRVALMEYTWNYLGLLLVCLAIFIWANSIKIGRFKVDKPLWTFCILKNGFWFKLGIISENNMWQRLCKCQFLISIFKKDFFRMYSLVFWVVFF